MSNVWDWIKSINTSKVNLVQGGEEIKEYVPYVVNKSLSYHLDSILFSNEMNRYPQIPASAQYYFYLYGLPRKNRYSKWEKKESSSDLELVKRYYNLNDSKASEALNILSKTQIEYIKNKLENCGFKQ